MLRLVIELEGQRQYDRTMTRFTEQVRDYRDLWPTVIGVLRRILVKQFADEGSGASGGWRALSPPYAAWKEKHYPGSPILQRTGALQESLTRNTAKTIKIARPDSLTYGTSVQYGIYHQSRLPRKRLPRRPIFDLNENNKNQLTKAVQRRLRKLGLGESR